MNLLTRRMVVHKILPRSLFGSVVNNKEDVEIELKKIFGSFKHPQTEKFLRNVGSLQVPENLSCSSLVTTQQTTSVAYTANIPAKGKTTIPYAFYSE